MMTTIGMNVVKQLNDKVIGNMRPEEDLFLTISETSEPRKWWVLYGEQCWVGQRRAGRFDEW